MPLVSRRFTAVDEAFAYLESFTNLERGSGHSVRSYRLDRMHALLDLFGNPERAFRTIHLAGSKGKGSTAIYVASALAAAGEATGLYTSPHVSSYRERITLAGRFFPDELYVETINEIAARIRDLDKDVLPARGEPTTFELLTLLGFLMFREWGCSWAVIETGIGGRLDATNVVSPEMCLLTPVELEHTELLGTTLQAIAGEKAGIIKEGVPVFAGYQTPEAKDVFAATAALRNAPIRFLDEEVEEIQTALSFEATEMKVRWRSGRSEAFHLAMPGDVQAENAALAVLALRLLSEGDAIGPQPPGAGSPLGEEAIRAGLTVARLPGRMEVIQTASGRIVLDGAHTPVSATRLLSSYRRLFPEPSVLIFGSVLGKDQEGMASALASAFRSIVISTPGTFKKSDPQGVHAAFMAHNPAAVLVLDPAAALAEAVRLAQEGRAAAATGSGCGDGSPLPILVTGSFYMVAEIRRLLVGPN